MKCCLDMVILVNLRGNHLGLVNIYPDASFKVTGIAFLRSNINLESLLGLGVVLCVW